MTIHSRTLRGCAVDADGHVAPCELEIGSRLTAADRSEHEGFPDVARQLRRQAEVISRVHLAELKACQR